MSRPRKPARTYGTRQRRLAYYLIYTDGDETEQNYLEGVRDSLPPELRDHVRVRVSHAHTTDLAESCLDEVASMQQVVEPWIVLDRDQVPGFDKLIADAEEDGIEVGWTNVCLEAWFNAYFGKLLTIQESKPCWHQFGRTFKEKVGQEYHKNDPRIYEKLRRYGSEERAMSLADAALGAARRDGKTPSESIGCTTIHLLVRKIERAGRAGK